MVPQVADSKEEGAIGGEVLLTLRSGSACEYAANLPERGDAPVLREILPLGQNLPQERIF